MARQVPEPLDTHDPIPGTSRARVSLVIGLFLLIGILAALIWFGIQNSETSDGEIRMLGYSGVEGVQLSWSPTAVAVLASVPGGSSRA